MQLQPILSPTPLRALLAAATLSTAGLLAQVPAVSPADRAGLEGSSYTHYPLGRKNARVQTLHDDVPGGAVINGHAYRRDAIGVRSTVDGLTCELQVTLSIAPHMADQASGTFHNNVGQNPVVVLPRQLVTFPSTDRPALDPAATFELVVPYQTPFVMPPQGGTLCVDVEVFSNLTNGGPDQNVSLYLDAHQQFGDGRAVQPGFRFGNGCPAPGNNADCYANLDLWSLPAGATEIDVSIRNGVADSGSGTTAAFLVLGEGLAGAPWPMRSDCPYWSSGEVWFALPGTMTTTGRYDGTLAGLPALPPGFRLWCQAGSIDLATVAMSFGDGSTLITPPLGALPIPAMRVAHGSDVTSATGSVSASVPVMQFF